MPVSSDMSLDEYPLDVPLWSFCLDSPYSVLALRAPSDIRGFRDAVSGEIVTYKALRDLSTDASVALMMRHKLRAGQTVCLFGTNSIWYPVALFSALRLGAIISGASPASTVEEISYCLKLAQANILFTSLECLNTAVAAATSVGIPKRNVILFNGEADGFVNLEDLVDAGKLWTSVTLVPAYEFPPGKKADEVCAFLSFSSGTTGSPKAVQISHANMISQCYQIKQISRPEMDSNTCLAVLPFFHIAGLSQLTFVPIVLNQEVVILGKFEMKPLLEAVKNYHISEMWIVPPILIRLANDPVVSEYDLLGVRQVIFGAAPTSAEILAAVKKRFPHFWMRNTWGMTEVAGAAATPSPKLQSFENAHTVGKALPGMLIKAIDPITGKEVGPNENGEILVKGPNVSLGYLNNEKATKETYEPDGYLHTGDLGSIDAGGLITIQDRIKELIKVKGIALAPAELEDLLLGHPLVSDAAVIGTLDSYAGEVPRAFVVLKDKAHETDDTKEILLHFVREKKSRFKWLAGGLVFVDEIPKSTSGKILRRLLKDKETNVPRRDGSKL